MRKVLSFLAAVILPLAAIGQEKDPLDAIRRDPWKSGTVFYMYDHGIPAQAKAPAGYKSFYISHYGRHGARNHSSSSDFDKIFRLFTTARQRGLLTERGEEFLKIYEPLYPKLRNCGGDLTPEGAEQQYKIAHNMYRAHRHIFRRGARIDAVSTTVPRCILTMTAFGDQLLRENPRLQISLQASNSTMAFTNPFSLYNPDVQPTDEGYNNKNAWWQKDSQKMFDEKLDPAAVFSPLIKDLSLLDEISTPRKLEDALFAIAVSAQCNSLIDRRLLDFIPIEEICRLYECHNFRFFASKGPDTLYQKGRQWAFVWRTMQDILDKADSDLQTGEYAARLRFGHDIIVMSLLVLLDIDGYNKPVGSLDEVSGAFRSYEYPMSLNTQFVFYKNRKGDVLVRLLYNERDIALPIPDCGTPYFYRWQDFRQYALGRIEKAKQIIATTQAPPKKQ